MQKNTVRVLHHDFAVCQFIDDVVYLLTVAVLRYQDGDGGELLAEAYDGCLRDVALLTY